MSSILTIGLRWFPPFLLQSHLFLLSQTSSRLVIQPLTITHYFWSISIQNGSVILMCDQWIGITNDFLSWPCWATPLFNISSFRCVLICYLILLLCSVCRIGLFPILNSIRCLFNLRWKYFYRWALDEKVVYIVVIDDIGHIRCYLLLLEVGSLILMFDRWMDFPLFFQSSTHGICTCDWLFSCLILNKHWILLGEILLSGRLLLLISII